MERVVFARDVGSARGTRAACVFRQVEAAMSLCAPIERRDLANLRGDRALPIGLERVHMPETLIAFDRAAHVNLADFEKRSVFTQDLAVEWPDVDVERLIWSSINTSRAIALGGPSWASLQLLPIETTAHHHLPPIDMGSAENETSVRLVAHGHQPLAAAAMSVLRRAGLSIVETDDEWCDDAAIHLHIGGHDLDSEEPRIVDSWASGRLVLQIPGGEFQRSRQDQLLVEHERTGILCPSIDELGQACKEVCRDAPFRRQLVKAGHKTVAPLVLGWSEIATFLLD